MPAREVVPVGGQEVAANLVALAAIPVAIGRRAGLWVSAAGLGALGLAWLSG